MFKSEIRRPRRQNQSWVCHLTPVLLRTGPINAALMQISSSKLCISSVLRVGSPAGSAVLPECLQTCADPAMHPVRYTMCS
ncbi:hypothetical protein CY34DRAFT_663619 [Suillus luteus UH-Slu-Lm8-n1]|uniref:Uncharacterized protein n=1 Tax=Suillus luteus UH-Slu-Lm8-n1 TaxID=930992 RepID=A0A0D0BCI4_9AGAM|nr:hypothetical protein CY34DRAFT_663619 [Suillus luteus UH-Slu-Lm8-n1]